MLGKAAQEEHVGRMVRGQNLARLADEGIDEIGSLLGFWLARFHCQRRHSEALRVRLGQVIRKAGAAQHQYKSMLLDRLDKNVHTRQLDLAQFLT